MKRVRVLVANRPRLMREMLMATIADQPDIETVGEVIRDEDLNEAVEQTQPDVLILALEEPERPLGQCGFLLGGPRPERPYFVEKFLDEFDRYNFRHTFKAGITGWAQVNGWRGDTSIAERVEFDLYYLRNWSLTFDLQIITLTFLRLFNSKNAY